MSFREAQNIQYKGIVFFLEKDPEKAAQFLNKSLESFGTHLRAQLSKKYLQKSKKESIGTIE